MTLLRRAASLAGVILMCVAAHSPSSAAADVVQQAIDSARMRGDQVQDAWRRPYDILQFLQLAPGQHVLDFYAGPGYFSELVAHIVGPSGSVLVYNNELYTQAAHHELTLRLARGRLPNATRLNAPSNYLQLEPASLDRVLFSLVYHDLYWRPRDAPESLGDAQKVLAKLKDALRPGGLVVVVDHAAAPTPRAAAVSVASRLHRIDPALVLEDFASAGFIFVGEQKLLRNPDDDLASSVFAPHVRRRTDRFVYKFRRPD